MAQSIAVEIQEEIILFENEELSPALFNTEILSQMFNVERHKIVVYSNKCIRHTLSRSQTDQSLLFVLHPQG